MNGHVFDICIYAEERLLYLESDFAHVVISNASHRGTLLATFVMSMFCRCTLCACQGHLRFAVVQRCKILVARTNVVVYVRDAYVAESGDR